MRHFDCFSGYGGFTIPAKKLGWETVGFSEIDKYASGVLEYNFSGIKNYGDITKIKGSDLPSVDIITGGSPCQDLSIAGKGAGLNGERSGLFFHFIRLIKEVQPMYFVWENVKGAFSSQRGWDFARVQIEMEQAGYDVWWQTLNAKDFGVPQNRERIFAVGIRKGSGREVLFKQIGDSQDIETQQQISSTIHAGYYKQGGRDQQYINKIVNTGHNGTNIYGTDGTGVTLKANGGGQGAKTGLYCVGIIPESVKEKGNYLPRERVFDARGNARAISTVASQHPMYAIPNSKGNVHALDSNYCKGSNNPNKSRRSQVVVPTQLGNSKNFGNSIGTKQAFTLRASEPNGVIIKPSSDNTPVGGAPKTVEIVEMRAVLTPDRINKRQNGRRMKEDGEPSFTLNTQDRHGIYDSIRIRRLTPVECERLMGICDNWTAKGIVDGKKVDISDTQRYKMCGNGVVTNCVEFIYELLPNNLVK